MELMTNCSFDGVTDSFKVDLLCLSVFPGMVAVVSSRCMFGYVHECEYACYTGMSTHQACIVACKTVKLLLTNNLGFIKLLILR